MSRTSGKYRIAFALTILLLVTSCSIQGFLDDGEYVLVQNHIETDMQVPREERITASEINKYIKQRPAPDILNIRSWFYLISDSTKTNFLNRTLRNFIGVRPTILDTTLTRRSAENIREYVISRGFFAAQEEQSFRYDPTTRTTTVTYTTIQGEPYRIQNIDYDIEDDYIAKMLRTDSASLIKEGSILDINALGNERKRIATLLGNEGFYEFSENNIEFRVDTTLGNHKASVEMILKKQIVGYDANGEPIRQNSPIYRIGSVSVMPDYNATQAATNPDYLLGLDTLNYQGLEIVYHGDKPNIRPGVLRRLIRLQSGALYNDSRLNTTYENLMRVDYIHSANIILTPSDRDQMKQVTYVGDHWSDTAETTEGLLDCQVRLSPAMRQNFKTDVEGTISSAFYGLSTTLGYQNRNLFRGAELFDMSLSFAYEYLKSNDSSINRNSTEFGGVMGFTFPQFLFPANIDPAGRAINPQTRVELSISSQNRRYYDRVLSNVSFGYSWASGTKHQFTVRPFDVSLVKMNYVSQEFLDRLQNPYLKNSYTTQMMAGISANYTYGATNDVASTDYTTLRVGLSTSGNTLSSLQSLFGAPKSDGHYTLFGIPYAQYLRNDITWVQSFPLDEESSIVYRLYGGIILPYGNSQNESLPIDRLFYGGGVNSMRGWSVRRLGPGGSKEVKGGYPSQFGNLKLEANVELRFPIYSALKGALFMDAGNIWYTPDIRGVAEDAAFKFDTALSQVALNTGIGVRLDVEFAVLRLDWGIQIYNPGKAEGKRWVLRNPSLSNTAIHLGIGYPF